MTTSGNPFDIDPDLISRCFDLSNLSFLIGTGLSKACGGQTMAEIGVTLNACIAKAFPELGEPFQSFIKADLNDYESNVERFLDKLYLMRGYLGLVKDTNEINESLIKLTRKTIYDSCVYEPDKTNLPRLFEFLQSIQNRKSGLARAQLFTLNYDLLIEECADELGILLNDGFDGAAKRWFNPSQFDMDFYFPSGVVGDKPVRCERVISYYKLHGSINWRINGTTILKGDCSPDNMFIYPSAEKYEASHYSPFSEMIRRFSAAITRPKSALICVGYGFGDAHINEVILQGLEQPHFLLIVIDPQIENREKYFPKSERFAPRIKTLAVRFEDFVAKSLPRTDKQYEDPTTRVVEALKKYLEPERS